MIDTNVLLVSISKRSFYHPIWKAFINEKYELCVTTEILLEYEEIIKRHMGSKLTESLMQLIENAPNVQWIVNYFKWNLIKSDPDDNKFTDCAIACGASYLVSNDKHFNLLKNNFFPKVNLLLPKDFKDLVELKNEN